MHAIYWIRDTKGVAVSLLVLACGAIASAALTSGCISGPSEDPEPPGGGQRYVLDYGVFATEIDSILTARGCDNLSCHGGGIRGTFQLSPFNAKDTDLDFAQASLQVTPADPATSPLLVKPLDESRGGVAHAGGVAFADTDDTGYQAILAWILAGDYR